MKNRYLVEEFKDRNEGERITFHALVDADSPQEAFRKAAKLAPVMYTITEPEEGEVAGDVHFYFSADELEEIDEGYRWAASDGSSVCYEVRLIAIIAEPHIYTGRPLPGGGYVETVDGGEETLYPPQS